MSTVPEYFGSLVFDDRVMKAKLPYDVYVSLKRRCMRAARWIPPLPTPWPTP